MPPDGVLADPAFDLDLHWLDPHVPTPPDFVVVDPALGLEMHRLERPFRPTASLRIWRLTSTCTCWTSTCITWTAHAARRHLGGSGV
jgi:hypothetical protein